MTINFTQPFFYKPGNTLLVDMLTGDSGPMMDAVAAPSGTEFLYYTGAIPGGGSMWVLQFGYTVPEPDGGWILLLGVMSIGSLGKGRRA